MLLSSIYDIQAPGLSFNDMFISALQTSCFYWAYWKLLLADKMGRYSNNDYNDNSVYTDDDNDIIFIWRKHENMSPYTDSRVITSYERIAPCSGTEFRS